MGDKYEVTFKNGKTFNYIAKNVKVIEPRECFSYFKRIADEVGLEAKVEGDRTINLLSLSYSKIERCSLSEDSIFSSIIPGISPK